MNDLAVAEWATAYFHWLEPQTREGGHQTKTYTDLLQLMHSKEFVWFVPNDDNRLVDGLDLRTEFLRESEAPSTLSPDEFGPPTILEVLVGLSRRLAFTAGGTAEGWAWQLLKNLELEKMSDPLSRRKCAEADEKLETLIWRNYAPDGAGGFFPLALPM
jgi:hypothetical protein